MIPAGSRVRLRNDPSVVGIITDEPPTERGGRPFQKIELPTGRKRVVPANQLEIVEEAIESADPAKLALNAILRDLARRAGTLQERFFPAYS